MHISGSINDYAVNLYGGGFVFRNSRLTNSLKKMVEEIIKQTTTPNIKLKNTMKGLGWEIGDSQKEGEDDLKETCERIEMINKLLIKKFGEPGERKKKEEGED